MEDTFNFKTKKSAEDAVVMLEGATGEPWRVERDKSHPTHPWAAMKTVTNLMSGKPVEIAADTPLCCDPSSETYWSM
jgi:hypothetical protein